MTDQHSTAPSDPTADLDPAIVVAVRRSDLAQFPPFAVHGQVDATPVAEGLADDDEGALEPDDEIPFVFEHTYGIPKTDGLRALAEGGRLRAVVTQVRDDLLQVDNPARLRPVAAIARDAARALTAALEG